MNVRNVDAIFLCILPDWNSLKKLQISAEFKYILYQIKKCDDDATSNRWSRWWCLEKIGTDVFLSSEMSQLPPEVIFPDFLVLFQPVTCKSGDLLKYCSWSTRFCGEIKTHTTPIREKVIHKFITLRISSKTPSFFPFMET